MAPIQLDNRQNSLLYPNNMFFWWAWFLFVLTWRMVGGRRLVSGSVFGFAYMQLFSIWHITSKIFKMTMTRQKKRYFQTWSYKNIGSQYTCRILLKNDATNTTNKGFWCYHCCFHLKLWCLFGSILSIVSKILDNNMIYLILLNSSTKIKIWPSSPPPP